MLRVRLHATGFQLEKSPSVRLPRAVSNLVALTSLEVYISGRPFVLRDSANPRESLILTDRSENLEAIEKRLKADILTEAARCAGLSLPVPACLNSSCYTSTLR